MWIRSCPEIHQSWVTCASSNLCLLVGTAVRQAQRMMPQKRVDECFARFGKRLKVLQQTAAQGTTRRD